MVKKFHSLFFILYSAITFSQIGGCSDGIISVSLAPIAGTTDLELIINSQSCNVHSLNNYTYNNNENQVTVCYLNTGLTMISNINSTIVLSGANVSGNQTLNINSDFYWWDNPSGMCSDNSTSAQNINLSFVGPLSEQRYFPLNNNSFELEKTKLYPNPNNGTFLLNLPSNFNQVSVKIFDASGKIISFSKNYVSGEVLNINNLAKGIYLIKIENNEKIETLKFIVN